VISKVETGYTPSTSHIKGIVASQGKLAQEVIEAAYSAFQSGLHAALLLSAILVFAGGILSFALLGRQAARQPSEVADQTVAGDLQGQA